MIRHITDLRQLDHIASDQTICVPVGLLREPFQDMRKLERDRRMARSQAETTAVVRR